MQKTLLILVSMLLMLLPLFEGVGVNVQRHYMKKQLRENKLSKIQLDTLLISKDIQAELNIYHLADEFDYLNNRYDVVEVNDIESDLVRVIVVQDKFEKQLLISLSKQMENPNAPYSKISVLKCKWFFENHEIKTKTENEPNNYSVYSQFVNPTDYHLSIFRPPILG